MLAELFDRIVTLGRTADKVALHAVPGDPRVVLVQHQHTLEERRIPPPLRDIRIEGVEDFASFVTDPGRAKKPEVYYSAQFVEAVLDADDRRERAKLWLEETERFALLRSLQETPLVLSQRQAIKFLRYQLHASGVDHVVSALRQIDFSRRSSGASTVEHGKESLGRQVEAAVQQADRIPESFKVSVPVWRNPGLRHITATVELGLFLDLDTPAIEIRLLSDELAQAEFSASEELRVVLNHLLVAPLFQGSAGRPS